MTTRNRQHSWIKKLLKQEGTSLEIAEFYHKYMLHASECEATNNISIRLPEKWETALRQSHELQSPHEFDGEIHKRRHLATIANLSDFRGRRK